MATEKQSLKEKTLSVVAAFVSRLKMAGTASSSQANQGNLSTDKLFKYHFLKSFLVLFALFLLWLAYAFLVPVAPRASLATEVIDVVQSHATHTEQVHGHEATAGNKNAEDISVAADMFENNRRKTLADVSGKNVIALLIEDFGLSVSLSTQVLETIPADVTLVLSPYADNLPEWAARIRARDQEFWLYVPVESGDGQQEDSGSLTLLSQSNLENNTIKINALKEKTASYAGVAMQNTGAFDSNPALLRHSLSELTGSGAAYLELNRDAPETALNFARMNNVPVFHKDMDLSAENEQQAEALAEKKGYAIVSVSLSPTSLEFLNMWIKSLDSKNLAVVPLSALHMLIGDSNDETAVPSDESGSYSPDADKQGIAIETLDHAVTQPPADDNGAAHHDSKNGVQDEHPPLQQH